MDHRRILKKFKTDLQPRETLSLLVSLAHNSMEQRQNKYTNLLIVFPIFYPVLMRCDNLAAKFLPMNLSVVIGDLLSHFINYISISNLYSHYFLGTRSLQANLAEYRWTVLFFSHFPHELCEWVSISIFHPQSQKDHFYIAQEEHSYLILVDVE